MILPSARGTRKAVKIATRLALTENLGLVPRARPLDNCKIIGNSGTYLNLASLAAGDSGTTKRT